MLIDDVPKFAIRLNALINSVLIIGKGFFLMDVTCFQITIKFTLWKKQIKIKITVFS